MMCLNCRTLKEKFKAYEIDNFLFDYKNCKFDLSSSGEKKYVRQVDLNASMLSVDNNFIILKKIQMRRKIVDLFYQEIHIIFHTPLLDSMVFSQS